MGSKHIYSFKADNGLWVYDEDKGNTVKIDVKSQLDTVPLQKLEFKKYTDTKSWFEFNQTERAYYTLAIDDENGFIAQAFYGASPLRNADYSFNTLVD